MPPPIVAVVALLAALQPAVAEWGGSARTFHAHHREIRDVRWAPWLVPSCFEAQPVWFMRCPPATHLEPGYEYWESVRLRTMQWRARAPYPWVVSAPR